jgi:hypothetical protein
VFAINLVTTTYFWETYQHYQADIALHFFGGMSIAYGTFYALGIPQIQNTILLRNKKTTIFFVVCVVALAAILWEDYEYIHDFFYHTHFQPSNADTMKDLFMGLTGGLFYATKRANKKTP